eukprot:11019074-Ditylum_brightwellii.AAC.1
MMIDPDLPTTKGTKVNEETDDGKKQVRALKLNVVAVCNLMMTFTTEDLMGMIYASMTTEWLSGLVHIVVVSLHHKYAPKDLVSKIELRRELNAVVMQTEEDPKILFKIRNHCMVLKKAPKEYRSVLTVEQQPQDDELEMSHLQDAMAQLYRTLYGGDMEDNNNKVGLTKADLECYSCGGKGHA